MRSSVRKIDKPSVQCIGKIAFKNRAAVSVHLSQGFERGVFAHTLGPYHCPHCGAWHFGHAPGTWLLAREGKPWIKRPKPRELAMEEAE